jgi:hypothetical protein
MRRCPASMSAAATAIITGAGAGIGTGADRRQASGRLSYAGTDT